MESTQQYKKSSLLTMIGIAVFFAIYLLVPAENGLTRNGAGVMGLLAMSMVIWLTVGTTGWCTLLIFVLAGFFKLLAPAQIFTGTFGHLLIAYVIGMQMLGVALQESGAAAYIAKWFLSRRFVQGHFYRFVIVYFIAVYAVTLLASGMAALVIMITLMNIIMNQIGAEKNDGVRLTCHFLTVWAITIGDMLIPAGRTVPYVLLGYMESYGLSMSVAEYVGYTIPLSILYSVLAVLIIRFMVRPSSEKFKNYSVDVILEDMKQNPLTKQAKFVLLMTVIYFVMALFPLFARLFPTLGAYFSAMGCMPYYLVLLVMALVRIDGKRCIDLNEIGHKINWNAILFFCAIMFFTSFIASTDLGITTWITALLQPMAEALSPVGIFVLCIVATTVLTNLASNMAIMAISVSVFMPIFISMYEAGTSAMNPILVLLAIGLAASYAFVTPAASIGAAMVIENYGDTRKMFLPNFVLTIFITLSLLAVGIFGA